MVAFLAVLLKILPLLTTALTLIGGYNGIQAGTVISYGASPSSASIWATVIPLLLAGLSKAGTVLGKQRLDLLLESGAKHLGLSDVSTSYAFDAVNVGRIAVYSKLYNESSDTNERASTLAAADVAFAELRERLFPASKAGD